MLITQGDNDLIPIGWQDQLANLSTNAQRTTHDIFDSLKKEVDNLKINAYTLLGKQS
jgi:hypothetical protein